MADLNDLLQERGELVKAMRKINDDAITNKHDIAGEQLTQYNEMERRLDTIGNAIKREQQLLDVERLSPKIPAEAHITHDNALIIYDIPLKNAEKYQALQSDNYKKGFWNVSRIGRRLADPRIVNALQVGTNTEGGYLVPIDYDKVLVQALMQFNDFRSMCEVITTSSLVKIAVETDFGAASWMGEEAPYPESDTAFGQTSLDAHKLGRIIKVSEELIRDAFFDLQSYIATAFGKSFGMAEEMSFVNGDGAGKPLGFIRSAQTGLTAAGASSITADEIIDLYYSLKRQYRARARFIMNDSTVKLVRKLKDGDGQYLWQPGLQSGEPDLLLGKPLVTSTAMPLATTGQKSIAFGDLSYYRIADRAGREMQRLDELYAANGQIGFKMSQRVDAKLLLAEAMQVLQQA